MVWLFLQVGEGKDVAPETFGRRVYHPVVDAIPPTDYTSKRFFVKIFIGKTNCIAGYFAGLNLSCKRQYDRGIQATAQFHTERDIRAKPNSNCILANFSKAPAGLLNRDVSLTHSFFGYFPETS
jgi:hypothetical protein